MRKIRILSIYSPFQKSQKATFSNRIDDRQLQFIQCGMEAAVLNVREILKKLHIDKENVRTRNHQNLQKHFSRTFLIFA